MTNYIYIPIMTPEMAHVANKWNNSRIARNKAAYQIIATSDSGVAKSLRRKFGTGSLEAVTASDKLCLLSHGLSMPDSGGALSIGNRRGGTLKHGFVGGTYTEGGTLKMYRVDQLARAIEKEGLTKSFVDLRLFCCNAGREATYNGQMIDPFAQRLKNAMVGRGYNAISVTGFTANLVLDYKEFFPAGTTFASTSTTSGVGLGVKLDGEMYTQDARLHMATF